MLHYSKETIAAIKLLEKQGFIIIDPAKETTIKNYAKQIKKPLNTVQNYVNRGKIKCRKIEHLNGVMLIQPDTLAVVPYKTKSN